MADTTITDMPAAALPLTGAELVPVVQGGVNKKTTIDDIALYDRSYGAWSDTNDQTGSTTAGTVMTFNTQDVTDTVTLVDGSKITVPNTGVYDLQFSSMFQNTDNSQHQVTIWIKINGTDVPNSATVLTVPSRKSISTYGFAVAAWNFFMNMNSSDYVELYWMPTSTLVTMEHTPATPEHPAAPSVIATIQQVA